jgi:hypothetical protein
MITVVMLTMPTIVHRNPHEWEHVEQLLLFRSCAARLRQQWGLLHTLASGTPALPTETDTGSAKASRGFPPQLTPALHLARVASASHRQTLEVLVRALDCAKELNRVAVQALGSALEALDAVTAGPVECAEERARVSRSLLVSDEAGHSLTAHPAAHQRTHARTHTRTHAAPLNAFSDVWRNGHHPGAPGAGGRAGAEAADDLGAGHAAQGVAAGAAAGGPAAAGLAAGLTGGADAALAQRSHQAA